MKTKACWRRSVSKIAQAGSRSRPSAAFGRYRRAERVCMCQMQVNIMYVCMYVCIYVCF